MKRSAQVLSILSLSTIYAANLQIDHVTVAGRDLKTMRSALQSAGIESEYGGPHANHATEMALVSFPDGSYLELIAIQPQADPEAVRQHPWAKFMNSNAGPCAWAIRSGDVDGEVRRLRAAGIEVKAPSQSGRTRPDGYRLEWQTAQVGLDGNGTFFPFLIRDFTPREQRAFPSGKPGEERYTGIARVVIDVSDLNQAIGRFRKAFDLPEPQRQAGTVPAENLAWFRDTPVILRQSPNERERSAEPHLSAIILGKKGESQPRGRHVSQWFGHQISWLDGDKLTWQLGIE